MCRYGNYGPYKSHFACFDCRKAFKRTAPVHLKESSIAPCPDCGQPMANMGLDFATPKRSAVEHWEVVAFLFRRGFKYHSCGCSGPGFRPSRWNEVPEFLESHKCRPAGESLAAKFAAREVTDRQSRAAYLPV